MINLEKTPAQKFSKRLVSIKYSQLIIEDLKKLEGVNKFTLKENYLLNSYVVNLVATWQIFIEELLEFGVKRLMTKTGNIQAKNHLDEKMKRFNTPNSKNIDDLFKDVFGIIKITTRLSDFENSRERINSLLKIRHSIAHTAMTSAALSLRDNFDSMEHLLDVAAQLEKIVIVETT